MKTLPPLAALLALAACAAPGVPHERHRAQHGHEHGHACARLDDATLVGKTEADAGALLAGCPWRVSQRDGQSLPGTMDYRPERRNLGVENGKVVWVRRG
ncbi:hypothetical protein EV683_10412 [Crenobacter luteus]|uniref:hypothetical protein n=1 Tax=Crenobacter luteus TaxID=1452487 RepID=UPI00104B8A29|nr:hypothetical protein [Crenobacter luteus]TCP14464.1 hypothetical protein EV683_10412 [Crenobacter luteus]